jgi:hypothetical protein
MTFAQKPSFQAARSDVFQTAIADANRYQFMIFPQVFFTETDPAQFAI